MMALTSGRTQYDRDLTDVFAVQDEITTSVLRSLNVQLFGADNKSVGTDNPDAHNAVLLGRHYHNNLFNLEKAQEILERAVSLDSNYADAYAGLASVLWSFVDIMLVPAGEKLPLIREYYE